MPLGAHSHLDRQAGQALQHSTDTWLIALWNTR